MTDEAAIQTDREVAVTSTSAKKLTEPIHPVDDASTAMLVEGKAIDIINDSSRYIYILIVQSIISNISWKFSRFSDNILFMNFQCKTFVYP